MISGRGPVVRLELVSRGAAYNAWPPGSLLQRQRATSIEPLLPA
jgi:hypothetical protein